MKPGSVPAKPGIVGVPMLTDVQIRKAKAADKPYKLTDGGGLHAQAREVLRQADATPASPVTKLA
jgi:hypothetical protein